MPVLVALAPAYFFMFGLRSRPDRSVFIALACFLFWPKVELHQPEALSGMSAYMLIWPITTGALALSVLLHRGSAGRPDRNLMRCLWAAGAAATVSFAASWFLGDAQGLWPQVPEPSAGSRIYIYVVLVQAVWFSYLFMRSIRSAGQVEPLIQLFAYAGLALIVESILFVYLKIPSPGGLALDGKTGRFQSFFYSSFDDVGFFMIVAFSSMLYYALARRRLLWFAAAAACVLPIFATFERAPLVGVICAGGVFFLVTRRRRLWWFSAFVPGCLALIFALSKFAEGLGSMLGGGVREDYASAVTLWYRLALWVRGVEVGAAAFPWGVGPGMIAAQMSCPVMFLAPGHRFMAQNVHLWETYEELTRGVYQSAIHNLFLTCFSENGLLGVLTIVLGISFFLRNFLLLLRTPLPAAGEARRLYLLWTCACAALAGLGSLYVFEMRLTLLFMILPLLHICSIGGSHFKARDNATT